MVENIYTIFTVLIIIKICIQNQNGKMQADIKTRYFTPYAVIVSQKRNFHKITVSHIRVTDLLKCAPKLRNRSGILLLLILEIRTCRPPRSHAAYNTCIWRNIFLCNMYSWTNRYTELRILPIVPINIFITFIGISEVMARNCHIVM